MDFSGKSILITGASAGIGRELAGRLSKQQTTLFLLARRAELLEEITSENNGVSTIHVYKCDVSNPDEVKKVFENITTVTENIDIAFLNAGVDYRNGFVNFDIAAAEEIIKTNLLGFVYCLNELLPIYLRQKRGMIVGLSSLADNRGFVKSGIYCGTKAAVTTILQSLRVELKPHNVKVITVKPGFVKTAMTEKNEFKMPFLMSVEKAADIIINGIKKDKKLFNFRC